MVMMEMIKEWLLARILKNRVVFFENDGEYHLINDIYFDGDIVICNYYDRKSIKEFGDAGLIDGDVNDR